MSTFGLDLTKLDDEEDLNFKNIRQVDEVVVPLKGGFGSALNPSVEAGDKVEAGEIIARNDDSFSTPVHSSVDGEVIEITKMDYFHEETLENFETEIPGIRIQASSGQEVSSEGISWQKEKPVNLRELLYLAGLTSFGQTGIPTEFKSSYFSPEEVNEILINGVRAAPFARHRVDYENEFPEYKKGLRILTRCFPDAQLHFALDEKAYRGIDSLSSSQRIKAHSVGEDSYMDQSKMLARELLGVDGIDEGGFLLEHGVLALDELVPLVVYRAVEKGIPFVRNRFSLTGPGAEPSLYEAPLGSILGKLVKGEIWDDISYLDIMGAPLGGKRLESLDLPLGKEFNSLVRLEKPKEMDTLAWLQTGLTRNSYTNAFFSALVPGKKKKADTGLHGEERPCVYCGYCSEVCPVDILPFQIYQTHTHDMVDEVNRLQPQRCVDCGLCSYVCPSKLPLSSIAKEAKKSQPGEVNNYVKYEETEEGLTLKDIRSDQEGRGEEVE